MNDHDDKGESVIRRNRATKKWGTSIGEKHTKC